MSLRTEPVRSRSSARVQELIDAVAAVTDEVGIDRVTTNLVAERADCSIGTFYRYFPDRVAILRALALRCASTVYEDCQGELALVAPDDDGLEQVLNAMARRLVERFRAEPGWEAIGFAHTMDMQVRPTESHLVAPPLRGSRTPRAQIARDIAMRFVVDDGELRMLSQHVEATLLITQSLVERLFAMEEEDDPDALELLWRVVASAARSVVFAHRGRRGDEDAAVAAEPLD